MRADIKKCTRVTLYLITSMLVSASLYSMWFFYWPHSYGVASAHLSTLEFDEATLLVVDDHVANQLGHAQFFEYGYDDRTRTFWLDYRIAKFPFPPLRSSLMNFPLVIDPVAAAKQALHGRVRVISASYYYGSVTIGYIYFDNGKIIRVVSEHPPTSEIRL